MTIQARNARIVCVVGTRPEAIKMAPVIWELKRRPWASVEVWVTEQHRDLLHPLLEFFGISIDRNFGAMAPGQGLAGLNARILTSMEQAFTETIPDVVVAQGDTTTVMAAAQACFYAGVPFAHVEAGLRTGDIQQPFPEEFNRIVVSLISRFNFAPTRGAHEALLREGIASDRIWMTGNTVIDALYWTDAKNRIDYRDEIDGRKILVTLHRRENFGEPIKQIFHGLLSILNRFDDVSVVYPVHPNPNVRSVAHEMLGDHPRIRLVDPLSYPEMVKAMRQASVILTDSGGIQEEAPALGKPVFIARNATERPEAVEEGCAILVGSDPDMIADRVGRALESAEIFASMSKGQSPYGDGKASIRIADALEGYFGLAS